MATFKDANGKTWTVALDAPTIHAVRQEFNGLDLVKQDGSGFEQLRGDVVLFVNVLYVVCREQAETASIGDRQFGQALIGDALERAEAAMVEAIQDFFPRSQREAIAVAMAKITKVRELGMKMALAKLSDPALEAQLVAQMEADMDDTISKHLTRLSSATATPVTAG